MIRFSVSLYLGRLIFYAADIAGVRLTAVADAGVGGVDVQVVRVGAIVLGS